jgi:hypothetical protein
MSVSLHYYYLDVYSASFNALNYVYYTESTLVVIVTFAIHF